MNPQEPAPPCPALCSGGAKDETPIPCGEAKDTFGVCIRHGRMSTNGELRFRLNCSDGSAYIRTLTAGQSEGWQNPHYHQQLKETYIVEKGWIGYVELRDGTPLYKKYGPGHVFTTQPGLVHNIYMPADSVIHTLKHSGIPPETDGKADWWSNDDCKILASLVALVFPENLPIEETPADILHTDPEKTYNAAYRHFDTLIWQVPAWSSALFAAIVVSVNSFLTPSSPQVPGAPAAVQSVNTIPALFNLSVVDFAAIQIGLFGVFTLGLAYTLFRFRWHQVGTKTWSRSKTVSPQLLLQLVVNVEAALLIFVAGALAGLPKTAVGAALVLVIGFFSYLWEHWLNKRDLKLNPPKVGKTDIKETSHMRGAS